MVANIGKITNLAATPSTGLVDGSDKLHSGILKVLESFSQGDMCISHAGFTITDGGSYTQYNLAQPIKFLKKGEFVNHTVTLTEAYTSSPVQNASHTRYDWVLINPATPELVIVQGTAASTPTVADITAGYIPIALVQVTAGTDDDKFDYSFQTYTMNVAKNSVSIGYDSSGYTETLSITANSGDTDITAKVADKDIIFKGKDSSSDITALTLDMSEAGKALFNAGASFQDDITIYKDANNADMSLSLGTSAAESLTISVFNGSSNKTAEQIQFSTATASGTANHGKMVFAVDGINIATIDDGGIDLETGKTFSINGTDLATSPITALNNATANELVTVGSTTTELDAEANLTFNGSTLAVTGAVTATTTIAADQTVTGTIGLITGGTFNSGYELCSTAGTSGHVPVPTMTKHVIYSHDHSGSGNAWVMPNAISGNIYYIKNIFTNPVTITMTGGETVDLGIHAGNGSTVACVTALNTITLTPQQSVTLQGVNDSIAPLTPGYLIIATGN